MEKVIVYQQFAGYADLFKEYGAQDERPDLGDDDGPAHIVDEIWRRGPVNAALKSANGATIKFDLAPPPISDVDSEENSPFLKAPQVVKREAAPDAFTKADRTPATLAKKLGIVRSEQIVTASGETWLHGYGADGQLIDARFLKSAE